MNDEHVNRLVYTSVQDLKSALHHCADLGILRAAVNLAAREGYKTKVAMLDRAIRRLQDQPGLQSPISNSQSSPS